MAQPPPWPIFGGSACAASPTIATLPADQRLSLIRFEAVVAALLADAVDQRFEMRKRALPFVLAHRHRLGHLVAVEHGQRDIDVGLAARRVEQAAACPTSIRWSWRRRFRARSAAVLSISSRVQPSTRYLRFANRPSPSRSRELLPSAPTIRSALMRRPSASTSSPSARRARGRRVDDDLDAGARRRGGERVDDVLPHDAEHAAALPAVHRDQPVVAVAHFAGVGERRALDRGVIGADRFEHAQAVLVDVDAGAGGAQPVAALVHAHAPAALRQRAGRGEAGKAGADDLGVSLAHGRLLMAARLLSWLRTGRSQPERRIYPWPVCAISPSA